MGRLDNFFQRQGILITTVDECQNLEHPDKKPCACGALCVYQTLVRINRNIYIAVGGSCLKMLYSNAEANDRNGGGGGSGHVPEFIELNDDEYLRWCRKLGEKFEKEQDEKRAAIERTKQDMAERKRAAEMRYAFEKAYRESPEGKRDLAEQLQTESQLDGYKAVNERVELAAKRQAYSEEVANTRIREEMLRMKRAAEELAAQQAQREHDVDRFLTVARPMYRPSTPHPRGRMPKKKLFD